MIKTVEINWRNCENLPPCLLIAEEASFMNARTISIRNPPIKMEIRLISKVAAQTIACPRYTEEPRVTP
jgi:hypothetical protein